MVSVLQPTRALDHGPGAHRRTSHGIVQTMVGPILFTRRSKMQWSGLAERYPLRERRVRRDRAMAISGCGARSYYFGDEGTAFVPAAAAAAVVACRNLDCSPRSELGRCVLDPCPDGEGLLRHQTGMSSAIYILSSPRHSSFRDWRTTRRWEWGDRRGERP